MKEMYSHPDSDLVILFQEGKSEAFDQLLQRHSKNVYQIILSIVKEKSLAEDLRQDTFLKAFEWLRVNKLKKPEKFSCWIKTVAYNESRSFLREEKKKRSIDNLDNIILIDNNLSLLKVVEEKELMNMIMTSSRLTLREKEIIRLRMAGLTFPEIAKKFKSAVPTARCNMLRACRKIRELVA